MAQVLTKVTDLCDLIKLQSKQMNISDRRPNRGRTKLSYDPTVDTENSEKTDIQTTTIKKINTKNA